MRIQRGLEVAVGLGAGVAGLKWGYDFGTPLAGLWLGLIMGANAGLFGVLVSSFLTARLFALLRRSDNRNARDRLDKRQI